MEWRLRIFSRHVYQKIERENGFPLASTHTLGAFLSRSVGSLLTTPPSQQDGGMIESFLSIESNQGIRRLILDHCRIV
ncbi:hypothetical protein Agabi119p4_9574 [Agaricus bisporus var. burnettii]|uniref:Uncharacterized protein n=1 Tax=Agaricus bisporus var. burnettii TaxID=192524 RepID=A0A8H7C325_AGABI|nr:hypothetical protein Agabi119p4_9574 [Agaricus bisporus var. burnettii]